LSGRASDKIPNEHRLVTGPSELRQQSTFVTPGQACREANYSLKDDRQYSWSAGASIVPAAPPRSGDGDEKVVAILLEVGADAGLRNKSRQNARDVARAAGRTAIAEMMK
jgi:hypothetical protein